LLTIAQFWLPHWLVKVFVGFVIFSMFALVVVGSGAQARLGYSMARDNMVPFSHQLKKVHPKTRTPIVALLVFLVIDVSVMWYGYLQTNTYGTLVGATSIIPYLIYFLITVAYAVKRRTTHSLPGAFDLGRWAWPVILWCSCTPLPSWLRCRPPVAFHGSDKFLGYGLGLALAWYFSVLVWRLRRGTAGVRPIEDLAEH
jgi:amino acid transporter